MARPCCRLPQTPRECFACGVGVHFSRSIQMVLMRVVWPEPPACGSPEWITRGVTMGIEDAFGPCVLKAFPENEKLALMWVGGGDYKTPVDFMKEAAELGVSKRIASLPKDFVLGETRVLLAHMKGKPVLTESGEPVKNEKGEDVYEPAIFSSFVPKRVERVVTRTMKAIAENWAAYEKGLEETGKPRKEWPPRERIVEVIAQGLNLPRETVSEFEWVKNDLRRGYVLFEVPDDDPDHAPRKVKRRALPNMPTRAEVDAAAKARAAPALPTFEEVQAEGAPDPEGDAAPEEDDDPQGIGSGDV